MTITRVLPTVLTLTTTLLGSAVIPFSSANANANANASTRMPLFAQTVTDSARISEGYANPEERLTQTAHQTSPSLSAQAFTSNAATSAATTNRHSNHHSNRHSNLLGHAPEIWVSDVSTVLFNDADDDGYFAGFSVTLDVDVNGDSADVYADIFLQRPGARPQLFHTTNVFNVYEQHRFDRYRVDVELNDNVQAGDYDLVIDIINAHSVEIEDTVSHRTHSNLSGLPLESRDDQLYPAYQAPYDNTVVTTLFVDVSGGSSFNGNHHSNSSIGFGVSASVTEYRGASGWVLLLTMLVAGAARIGRSTDVRPLKQER